MGTHWRSAQALYQKPTTARGSLVSLFVVVMFFYSWSGWIFQRGVNKGLSTAEFVHANSALIPASNHMTSHPAHPDLSWPAIRFLIIILIILKLSNYLVSNLKSDL